MKKQNQPLLDKYLAHFDEVYENAWEKEKERLGWNKEGDEEWQQFLEDRKEDFEERLVISRRQYKLTVRDAIEAKERGESFPMFPIPEDVK